MVESTTDDVSGRLRGVMCAAVTPIQDDGFTVDWAGVQANAVWLVEQGIEVLVVNGSIGEYALLSDEDRRRAVFTTAEAVDRQAILIAGCSDNSPRGVVELCQDVAEAGAAAVMLLVPHYFRLHPLEIVDFFAYVDQRSPLPYLVYNNPAVTGFEIPLEALVRVSELSGFLGFKEASPNLIRYHELHTKFEGSIPVIAANESNLFHALSTGASGCMTATAAFAPAMLSELFSAFERGDLVTARAQFARLHAFRRLFQDDVANGYAAYLPYTKAAMNFVGLAGGRPHFPMRPLPSERLAKLRLVLARDLGLRVVEPVD